MFELNRLRRIVSRWLFASLPTWNRNLALFLATRAADYQSSVLRRCTHPLPADDVLARFFVKTRVVSATKFDKHCKRVGTGKKIVSKSILAQLFRDELTFSSAVLALATVKGSSTVARVKTADTIDACCLKMSLAKGRFNRGQKGKEKASCPTRTRT